MLTLQAHAKINLNLFVTGRDANGMHTLFTVMQSVSSADTVSVARAACGGVAVTCDVPELAGENNIAHAAATDYLRCVNAAGDSLRIHIQKHVPVAAGLGGGSADAAAVLLACNRMYQNPLSNARLQALAASLGADVPFCLVGGTARCTGTGAQVDPLPPLPDWPIVLIKPCEKTSTGEMYRRLDANKGLPKTDVCDRINWLACDSLSGVCQQLHNDFLPLWHHSPVPAVMDRLHQLGAAGVSLTGSGPTVFALFQTQAQAQSAAEVLRRDWPDCMAASLCAAGCEFID